VRAAREAECRHFSDSAPFNSGFFKSWKDSCVQRKATRATEALFPEKGAACVTEAFQAAMLDFSPQPNQRAKGPKIPTETVALSPVIRYPNCSQRTTKQQNTGSSNWRQF